MLSKIVLTLLLSGIPLFAQFTYPLAPEVWSKPEKLLPDSMGQLPYNPFSLTTTGDTLLYGYQYVYFIHKDSAGNWHGPEKLSPLYGIPNYSPDYPVLTPDKKTLYFTDLRSFRMYKCRFNDSTGVWGTPEVFYDNGFNVNPRWYCINFLNDSTMFVVGEGRTRLARMVNGKWFPNYEYPKPGKGLWWFDGIWLYKNGLRAYLATGSMLNNDIYLQYISDTITAAKELKVLNLSRMSDSLYQIGEYAGRSEYFPYLTPDRKKMVFIANYDSVFKYYVSRLIIDENGDSVLTGTKEESSVEFPKEIEFYQNYPNPFNPETTLSFRLPNEMSISLKIYSIDGSEIRTLAKGRYPAGYHTVRVSGFPASGIYIASLITESGIYSQKILHIK
ncbi:MAG: hypothetical protein FMNOHCHN_03085 [Ignavibacteriaceae bacterium]|nr:hypothetical protein [Ignavibacteriaceae bacterium]